MNIRGALKMTAGGILLFGLGAARDRNCHRQESAARAVGARARVEQVVHDYLLAHPEILAEMSSKLDQQQQVATEKAQQTALSSHGQCGTA